MSGTWNTFNAPSGLNADTMLLLTDGTVLVHDANRPSLNQNFGGATWYRLTPNGSGDYRNGNWSGALPMSGQRQFFASGVLKDGRVYVVGGEYSDILGNTDKTTDNDTRGEIFDPASNTWSAMTKPTPAFDFIIGDAISIVLEDGRVLFGALGSSQTAIWDPSNNSWIQAGTRFGTVANTKTGQTGEESWCLLPNNNVLTVQTFGATATQNAEMYVPSEDRWITAGVTPQTLPIGVIGGKNFNEIGGAVTLQNGHAFFVGASGRTAVYLPGATPTDLGSWVAGPNLPADPTNANSPNRLQTSSDGACVLLPNGHVLITSGPVDPSANGQFFSGPVTICDYDPNGNTLSVPAAQPTSAPGWTWMCCFLLLPNGHVLMSGQQNTINEYVPDAAELTPLAQFRPVLTAAPTALIAGHAYQIAGTQLNGLSHANGYGDDRQNATNFPLVRLRNGGDVRYCRTHGFSTMGIATAGATVTAIMEVPFTLLPGSWTLEVVTNAITSAPLAVQVGTRDCYVVMDRSNVSHGEVQGLIALNGAPAIVDPALLVIVEGYTANELGLTAANLASPPNPPTFAPPLPGVQVVQRGTVLPEDPSMPPNVPQRFAFPFAMHFDSDSMFGFGGDFEDHVLTAAITAAGATVSNSGVLRLLKSPNPYILDGDSGRGLDWWTSIDMRVFQVPQNGRRFAVTMGSGAGAATTFIQSVLTNLNNPAHPTLGAEFDNIDPQEASEDLALAPTDAGGTPVFNFAIAKVHLRDLNLDAANVRVFFRMWPAQQTSAGHDPQTLYRTFTAGARHVPLLGRQGDEIATIPFFAAPRVNSAAVSMTTQTDAPNVRTIAHDTLGLETVAYFGCWLDINQPNDLRFPARLLGTTPGNLPDGPFMGAGPLLSIQQHIRSLHQCLIAEVNLDGQTIPNSADPSTSDKLAQRNLAILGVPNPGVVNSRIAPQTLQIRPTPAAPLDGRPDELMIDWGTVPGGTHAELYLPTVDADAVIAWAHRMYVSNRLAKVDAHTLRCAAGGVTFVPIPGGGTVDHVGLLSIELPPTVRKGQRHSVRVRQLTGARFGAGRAVEIGQTIKVEKNPTKIAVAVAPPAAASPDTLTQNDVAGRKGFLYRRTIGAFSVVIPVSTRRDLLPTEERTLSILRHIEKTVPIETKWWPVFRRLVEFHTGRVAGMGGDPTKIIATGDGNWQHPGKGSGQGDDRDQDSEDHDHGHVGHDDDDDDAVTGKIVSLRYDHFGDFSGFVIETADDDHVVVLSTERRIERLAREAFAARAIIRVHLLRDHRVGTLAIAGQVDD